MLAVIAPLAAIYELNTDLLVNCLEGVADDAARRRPEGGANSLAFVAAHLADSRHFLTGRLGRALPNPLTPYLADARTIDDVASLPTLEEIRTAWLAVSEHLRGVLESLDEAALAPPQVHRFPFADTTPLGLVGFLAQHDSYHVGQAAFLRRQLGLPAMAYTRGTGRRDRSPAT